MFSNHKSCKIKGKYPEPKRDVFNTGPGAYELPDTKSKLGARFNTTYNKNALEGSVQKDNPSPFSYNPKRYPENINENSGFSIGGKDTSQNMNEYSEIPGPGSY